MGRGNSSSTASAGVKPGTMRDVMKLDGTWYSTKGLAAIHPGGDLAVLLSNEQDATALFNSSHRRRFPHEKYTHLRVPEECVDVTLRKATEAHSADYSLYFELCERIKPVLGRSGGFAPPSYFAKVFVLLAGAMICDLYSMFYAVPVAVSLLQGFFMALIGLNIQHDANHGAVSRNPRVNRLLGMSQDYIGGNSLSWSINHNTIHHVFCNDPERDRDLQIPLLRLHDRKPWVVFYMIQNLYVAFLEAGFGLVHVAVNTFIIWSGPTKKQQVLADAGYWGTHRWLTFVFAVRLAVGCYTHDWQSHLLHIAIVYSLGGLYLAFFFLISHNFEGVEKNIDATSGCFVRNQVETSSNVGGWLLAQLNGGLNFQIEHHLFPRVHHSFYPELSPIVREFCERRGIAYVHFPNVIENTVSLFTHLGKLGASPTKH